MSWNSHLQLLTQCDCTINFNLDDRKTLSFQYSAQCLYGFFRSLRKLEPSDLSAQTLQLSNSHLSSNILIVGRKFSFATRTTGCDEKLVPLYLMTGERKWDLPEYWSIRQAFRWEVHLMSWHASFDAKAAQSRIQKVWHQWSLLLSSFADLLFLFQEFQALAD